MGVTAADVAAGDQLPGLALGITPRTVVMGASASRDWQPQHHDQAWAMDKVGTDIFLNTPHQAGLIERFLTDWTGPHGRLGALTFRMRRTVTPGDRLDFRGTVASVGTDERGTCWVEVDVTLAVGDETATECRARIAIPETADDNPWSRADDSWNPRPSAPE